MPSHTAATRNITLAMALQQVLFTVFRFLDLPKDVRFMVYRLLFRPTHTIWISEYYLCGPVLEITERMQLPSGTRMVIDVKILPRKLSAQLLRVSRTIHNEAKLFFYACVNSARLHKHLNLNHITRLLVPNMEPSLRNLAIEFIDRDYGTEPGFGRPQTRLAFLGDILYKFPQLESLQLLNNTSSDKKDSACAHAVAVALQHTRFGTVVRDTNKCSIRLLAKAEMCLPSEVIVPIG